MGEYMVYKYSMYLTLRKIDVYYHIIKMIFSLIFENKRTKTIKEKLGNEKE